MTTRDLLERRASLVTEMRSITNSPGGDGGDLSAEQGEKFNSMKTQLEQVEQQLARQKYLDEAERRMQGESLSGGHGDRRLDDALRGFSLTRAIAGAAGLNVDWARERELSAEIAKRAGRAFQGVAVPMTVFHQRVEKRVITTLAPAGGPGGNLIAEDYREDQYIDRLRAALVIRRLGAQILSGLVGNVTIPKLDVSSASGWVAENAALSFSDFEHDPVTLAPKHVGCISEFSRNLLLQTSPDVEDLLRGDFAKQLAEAIDKAAIKGGGSNEPTGILSTSGIGAVSLGTPDGGAPTWAGVIALISEAEIDNAMGGAFLTNPKAVKKMRSTAKVTSTDSVMIQEEPNSLAGYPLASTNNVPSNLVEGSSGATLSALIFGDFTDLLLGYWSELDILVNPYESTAYSKGNVQIRAMATCDVKLRHPESFAAIQDMVTT
ncbi:MAG: phage major capsid protein [Candidatus Binatia bacterium]